jgi:hypothetical protein
MPTPTYIALSNITLGSAASSITFSSIPATYRDLVLVFSGAGSTTLEGRLRLNGDTGSNYIYVRFSADGSTQSSTVATSQTSGFVSGIAKATTTGALQITANIMDYSATDKHKTIISRADEAGTGTESFGNRWQNTAAITSVQIFTSTGNWAIGTTAALYGIAS